MTFFFSYFVDQLVFVMKENIPPGFIVNNIINFLHYFFLLLLIISFDFTPKQIIHSPDMLFPGALCDGNFIIKWFLTAFNQQELVTRASEVGAMAFLVKPFSPEDLLPAIEVALSRFQQLTQLESEVSDLTERLETRKPVERAKGVLGVQMGLSEPDAFRWIQKAAMDRRIGMVDVARTILDQLEK
jgi:hypothetical protein